mgnify:CR=1 FL=1
MIQSLTIQNFQSHKNSNLEFCNGINVITGNSNCGKTAILRSLNWLINNRPGGLSFKSSFADKKEDCKVSIVINDQTITKTKNTSVNSYEIGSSLFDVVGSNVPAEVSALINISDINFQNQFDKHFLLMDSAGEVGRTINKVVKLDIIDELISNINSKVLSTNKEIEFKKSDVIKLEESLKKFENIEYIELLVTKVIKLYADIKEDETIISALDHIVAEIKKLTPKIAEIEDKFTNLETEIGNIEKLWIDYNANNRIIKDTQYLIDSVKLADKVIRRTESIIADGDKVEGFENNYKKLNEKSSDLSKISAIIKEWGLTIIKDIEIKIKDAEDNFDKIIAQNGCPLCNRKY